LSTNHGDPTIDVEVAGVGRKKQAALFAWCRNERQEYRGIWQRKRGDDEDDGEENTRRCLVRKEKSAAVPKKM
jgi:hypothetical protein